MHCQGIYKMEHSIHASYQSVIIEYSGVSDIEQVTIHIIVTRDLRKGHDQLQRIGNSTYDLSGGIYKVSCLIVQNKLNIMSQ